MLHVPPLQLDDNQSRVDLLDGEISSQTILNQTTVHPVTGVVRTVGIKEYDALAGILDFNFGMFAALNALVVTGVQTQAP